MNFEDVIGEAVYAAPQPEPDIAELFEAVLNGAVQEAIREENAALEFLCYLAQRDGHGVMVQRWNGRIYDAHVSPHIAKGQAYIFELDRMGLWDSSGTWLGQSPQR